MKSSYLCNFHNPAFFFYSAVDASLCHLNPFCIINSEFTLFSKFHVTLCLNHLTWRSNCKKMKILYRLVAALITSFSFSLKECDFNSPLGSTVIAVYQKSAAEKELAWMKLNPVRTVVRNKLSLIQSHSARHFIYSHAYTALTFHEECWRPRR